MIEIAKDKPNVFISYSWENEEHNEWVKRLADLLIEHGVNAILDKYDVDPWDRIPHFMEQAVTKSDKVLIICTEKYKQKADSRVGGVGYEEHIISEELMRGNERKFIAILKKGDGLSSIPNCLRGKNYYDLRESVVPRYEEVKDLIIYGIFEQSKKPSCGDRPKEVANYKRIENPEDISIVEIIADEVTAPRNDGTLGCALYKVPFKLSKVPSKLWADLFINAWNYPYSFSTMHRPGIASVRGNRIILDGTTLEEVQKYHKETLIKCVKTANQKEKEYIKREEEERLKAERLEQERKRTVEEIASKIVF